MQNRLETAFTKLGLLCLLFYAIIMGTLSITGSIQAYYYELDEWLNPHFYHTTGRGKAQSPTSLIEKLEKSVPGGRVWYMEQPKGAGRSVMMAVEPIYNTATKTYAELPHTYYYMDPVSAEIVGARTWGACCFEPENLMNFTYELHRTLLLPGKWGLYITGGAAIAWFLACIAAGTGGLQRFLRMSYGKASLIGVAMMPIAVSSIALNLSDEVFRPVVNWFSPVKPTLYGEYAAKNQTDFGARILSYDDAYKRGSDIALEKGWNVPVGELFYSHIYNFYGLGYGLRDPKNMGNNWIFISGDKAEIIRERFPLVGTNGEIFAAAQLPIHSGRILGGWSQFYVFLIGLITFWLCCLTGRFALTRLLGG